MSARLTHEQRIARSYTEEQWQRQVCDLAEAHGYCWVHIRAARTQSGWRVPVSGPLGKGWPDLVLLRAGRTIYVELKREMGATSDEQAWVHEQIRAAGNECYVWRPSEIDQVIEVLR